MDYSYCYYYWNWKTVSMYYFFHCRCCCGCRGRCVATLFYLYIWFFLCASVDHNFLCHDFSSILCKYIFVRRMKIGVFYFYTSASTTQKIIINERQFFIRFCPAQVIWCATEHIQLLSFWASAQYLSDFHRVCVCVLCLLCECSLDIALRTTHSALN